MSINICFITARILKKPEKLNDSSGYMVKTEIYFPHAKNYFAHAITFAQGKMADNLLELYMQGDYIIIEGELLILDKKNRVLNIIIHAIDIQPASIITD